MAAHFNLSALTLVCRHIYGMMAFMSTKSDTNVSVQTMFTMTGLALQKITSVPAPAPLSGCFGLNIPGYFTYVWYALWLSIRYPVVLISL